MKQAVFFRTGGWHFIDCGAQILSLCNYSLQQVRNNIASRDWEIKL
jgi:hypothetical protein